MAAAPSAEAAAGINQQINFQGRLLNAAGAVVPDGNYNMEFKIYQDGTGCVSTGSSPCGGTLKWTETRQNSNSQGVTVKNGYFSVALGSVTAFGSGVDWNQDTLWLSTNIGGTATGASPVYDGEMLPFRRLSAAPYALQAQSANQLGGLSASQYVQLAQGIQSANVTTNPAIGINATSGSSNLITLQASGTDVFDVTSTGNLQFGNNADKTISVATATSGNNGNNLTVQAGSGNGTNKNGGNLVLQGGNSTGSGTPGNVIVKSQTNATTAFQVQNSTGQSLLTVDTATSNISLLATNANSAALSSWTATTSLSVGADANHRARVRGGAVVANGYIYHIGGVDGATNTLADIEYAKLNTDGTVGSWTAAANAISVTGDSTRRQFQPVVANGYLYIIGGRDNTNTTRDTSYYAKLNADGSVGTWSATTVLPSARFGQATVAYNGYIFVIGGFNSSLTAQTSVYSAKVNADGTLGSWSTLSGVLPTGLTNINGASVANGYVYIVGGFTSGGSSSTSIYHAKLKNDGTIDTTTSGSTLGWVTQTAQIPSGEENIQTFVANGYLYAIGGDSSDFAVAYQLNNASSNGSVTGVTLSPALAALPNASTGEAAAASANGYFYILGGSSAADGGGTVRSTVYYASSARIKAGGNLDLLAYDSNQTLNEGNTGGQLTAGNTTIVGTLQVQDAATFSRGLAIGDSLSVGGTAAFRNAANATTSFQVQNASGTSILDVDTTNGRLGVNNAAPGYALDVTGDISTTTQYRVGSTIVCTSSGCTANGTSAILNQTSLQSSSNFHISGSGTADTSLLTPSLDVASAGTLGLGTSTATTINVGGTNASTITVGQATATNTINIGSANPAASAVQTINIGNGSQTTASSQINVNILSAGAGTNGTATLNLANNERVTQVDVGNVVADASRTLNLFTGNTSTALTDTINIGTGNPAGTGSKVIHIGDGTPAGGNAVTVGSSAGSSTTTIQGGTGGINNKLAATASLKVTDTGGNNSIFQANVTNPVTNYVLNPSAEDTFTANDWVSTGLGTGATVSRTTSFAWNGTASAQVVTTGSANSGAKLKLGAGLPGSAGNYYAVSFYGRLSSGTFSDIAVVYSPDGTGGNEVACIVYNTQTIVTTGWSRITCAIQLSAVAGTASAYIGIKQTAAASRTFYIDGAQAILDSTNANPKVYGYGTLQFDAVITSPVGMRNLEDSSHALSVQNSAGFDLFVVDSVNMAVRIGGAGYNLADNLPTTLVVDIKSGGAASPGDPTGDIGAIYYNFGAREFRCYTVEAGWTDCMGVNRPNTRRTTYIPYPGSGTAFNAQGDIADTSTTTTLTAQAATTTLPALLDLATSTTSGNVAGVQGNFNYAPAGLPIFQAYSQITSTASVRFWTGLTTNNPTNQNAAAPVSGSYAMFRYDTSASDTTYKCITAASATQTITDSGVTVTTSPHRFEVRQTATNVIFKIDGLVVCTNTTNLPGSVNLKYQSDVATLTTAAKSQRIAWMYVDSGF